MSSRHDSIAKLLDPLVRLAFAQHQADAGDDLLVDENRSCDAGPPLYDSGFGDDNTSTTDFAPLHREPVATWLDALVIAPGEDLLRVKGIIDVVGRDNLIVVQAVQRLCSPPAELAAWPRVSVARQSNPCLSQFAQAA